MSFGALAPQQQQAIHDTSMRILQRVGVRVDDEEIRRQLDAAGADVDGSGGPVRMPETWLRALLAGCPKSVSLGGRGGSEPRVVGVDGGTCFWPGNALYIVEEAARRPLNQGDFIRLTRLVDRLDHVHGMVGVAVSEFPPPERDFRTMRLMARHTAKHLRPVITSMSGIDAVMEMAAVLDDGRPAGSGACVSFGYSIVSPLHWTDAALAVIARTSGHGLPLMLNAEPMAGATSPVTLAGSIAQANAETLSGIAIAQVLEPGRPCFHNAGFAHVLDMRTAVALGGSPEVFLMGAAAAQMARFYNLPSASWVGSESLVVDGQAASEKAMGFLLHLERGVNLIWGMGQLESQLSISAEQLVVDDEIAAQVQRLARGVEVDGEHLAGAILEDDGKTDFLTHPHTVDWFRSELTDLRLGNRLQRERWADAGCPSQRRQAQARVEELLAPEWEPVLTEEQERELERIELSWRE